MGFGSMIQAEGPQPRLFLDMTKVTVKTLGEKYGEEHDGLHLSGYLIEPFPDFFQVHRSASWSQSHHSGMSWA